MRQLRDDEKIKQFHDRLDSLDGSISRCDRCHSIDESLTEIAMLDSQFRNVLRSYGELIADVSQPIANMDEQKTDKFHSIVQRLADLITAVRVLREWAYRNCATKSKKEKPGAE
jgi:hypothetical protein